ncbi:MAG: polyprenyl diphosphate synthase [Candidatus Diapherotrites archaeon]|nr:polyprenyl diphosphate synthase [Candidatus Diapherotrites archaeon]
MLESIAFIPDGNRRYAKLAGISFAKSYSVGTQKAWDVLEWLKKYPSITTGSFYTFSLKNFQRSKLELSVLMKIFEHELDKVKKKKIIVENGIRLRFIGKRELFSKSLQKKMTEVEKYTSQFDSKVINLALGYDGQTEIIDATKKFASDVASNKITPNELDTETFRHYLYSDFKAPDLIVRTSKEQRLSGFLTYQSSYSELAFIDKYWPELTETDVDKIVFDYETRERRFGK